LKQKVDHIFDFRGSFAPIALLQLTRELDEMKVNEIMEIIGCGPETLADLLRIVPASSFEFIHLKPATEDSSYCICLRKRGKPQS